MTIFRADSTTALRASRRRAQSGIALSLGILLVLLSGCRSHKETSLCESAASFEASASFSSDSTHSSLKSLSSFSLSIDSIIISLATANFPSRSAAADPAAGNTAAAAHAGDAGIAILQGPAVGTWRAMSGNANEKAGATYDMYHVPSPNLPPSQITLHGIHINSTAAQQSAVTKTSHAADTATLLTTSELRSSAVSHSEPSRSYAWLTILILLFVVGALCYAFKLKD